MRFVKMHGIGNDYVYVNTFEESVADAPALARAIADRHTGVGADGLILLTPAEAGVDAHLRMRMYNADGSESEMCGNGIRCVCKLAYDDAVAPGVRDARPMRIQTGAGVLSLDYELDGRGRVSMVTVDMGEPIVEPARVPVLLPGRVDGEPIVDARYEGWSNDVVEALAGAGGDGLMSCVSMGNPHVVFYVKDVKAVALDRIGPVIEHASIFPNRINAHIVQIQSEKEVTMRTWERGTGLTQACGTGACAVCVAGVLAGRTVRKITAHLPGGDLELRYERDTNHVLMTGPAAEVFRGDWPD